jgi:hypothetical protein
MPFSISELFIKIKGLHDGLLSCTIMQLPLFDTLRNIPHGLPPPTDADITVYL